MEEMLREGQRAGDPYDLVHFDGHGTFLPYSQIGGLYFEKPEDGSGESKSDPHRRRPSRRSARELQHPALRSRSVPQRHGGQGPPSSAPSRRA